MTDNTTPIKFDAGRDGYATEGPTSRKPLGAPKKDFQRILGNNKRDPKGGSNGSSKKTGLGSEDAEELEEIAALDPRQLPNTQQLQKQPVSLFELSKGKQGPVQPAVDPLSDAASKPQSPAALFAKLSNETRKPFTIETNAAVKNPVPQIPKEEPVVHQDKTTEDYQPAALSVDMAKKPEADKKDNFMFSQEQPDLSYVNPLNATSQPIEAPTLSTEKPLLQTTTTQQLVDQIVKQMYTMKVDGKTETTMLLKNPPAFDGAHVILTSFDTAKGEFNIKFENLTQIAQQLIEQQKSGLLTALQEKGYNVHILTATTYDETRLFTGNVDQPSKERDDQREQEGFAGGEGRGRRDEEEA